MWKFGDKETRALTKEEKTVIWTGATCVLVSLFDEFEEMDINKMHLGVELLDRLGHSNRAFFAAETFLMLFDDKFTVPLRAIHEAFAVAFCMHTAGHVIKRDPAGEVLRAILYPILTSLEESELSGPQDSRPEAWTHSVSCLADKFVPEFDYELGIFFSGAEAEIDAMKVVATGTKRPPFYFTPYGAPYIAARIDDYVTRTHKILLTAKNHKNPSPSRGAER